MGLMDIGQLAYEGYIASRAGKHPEPLANWLLRLARVLRISRQLPG